MSLLQWFKYWFDSITDNMDRFGSTEGAIENGGMFTREQIQRLTQYLLIYIGKLCNFMDPTPLKNWNLKILPDVWSTLTGEWTSISSLLAMNFHLLPECSIKAEKVESLLRM